MFCAASSLVIFVEPIWSANWAWSLPLIVLTVVIHVLGLGLINRKITRASVRAGEHRHPTTAFVVIMAATTLAAIILHSVEAFIWAVAYRALGALPDQRSAVLYSLNAMTSYGHVSVFLVDRWQLMGAMEALNGWLLFGLTTAFLFATIQKAAPLKGNSL